MIHSRFRFKLLAVAGIVSMLFLYSLLCALAAQAALGRPLREAGELGFFLVMLSLFASLVLFALTMIAIRSVARSWRVEPVYLPEETRATWGNLNPELLNQEKSSSRRRKRLIAMLKLKQRREARTRG